MVLNQFKISNAELLKKQKLIFTVKDKSNEGGQRGGRGGKRGGGYSLQK
jgi:hypothetical protein